MPGSVSVVESFGPQELASEGVNGKASCALGELNALQSNVTLEHKCIGLALHLSWLTKVKCSCGVGCAVLVLRARVAQVDGLWVDSRTLALLRLVVDDSCVSSRRRDSVERETHEAIVLRTYALQLISAIYLVECSLLVDQLILQPGEVFTESSAISNVTLPHTL